MSKPKKRKKSKGRIVVKQNVAIARKDSIRKDTIPKIQGRPPANNGATFKVKIRKK